MLGPIFSTPAIGELDLLGSCPREIVMQGNGVHGTVWKGCLHGLSSLSYAADST